ncbi:MAG: T9SS type A sorting domain-containing protein [Bacteroidales bacterium]
MKKKSTLLFKVLLSFSLISLHTGIFAQISQPGTPPSFLKTDLSENVPVIPMEKVDVEALLQEDMIFDTIKDIPWRFGDNLYVDITPENSGIWDILENGDKIWRASIESEGAYTINLTFDKYKLPPGAELYVYNRERSRVLGAFTEYNNQDDGYFATTLVEGDHITVEYFEPSNVNFPGELSIEMVTHAYRDPFEFAKGFGDSGSCNLNVACTEADDWQQQVRSVVMLVTGGNGFCTGATINNTQQDQTPYVLSANHCYRNPSTVVFWFNWQSEECANPPSVPPYNSMSGATQISRNSSSDFWLMELNQPIPDEYNPYYAGWNRNLESVLNETIIGVHHPRGDIKKFSYADGGVQSASYLGSPGSGSTHWRIVWSGGTTTEPGSSGSPIFDAQGRILGQLHGGYAACGNTQPDWYGRFGISWNGGGSATTRLSEWLDPTGSNVEALGGLDPFSSAVSDPLNFSASTVSSMEIDLQWQLNEEEDFVMIAANDSEEFGIPFGPYATGDDIDDGGTVIYMGKGESFIHGDLESSTQYFYRIWSYAHPGPEYSTGIDADAFTTCEAITVFPFFEGFNTEEISPCWQQEFIVNEVDWLVGVGNNDGYPFSTHEGSNNVYYRVENVALNGSKTKLIGPVMDLDVYGSAQLSFFYANPALSSNQDILRVFYRTQPEGEWQLLETLDFNQFSWANVILDLPELSSETQIAFEAEGNRGRGISLDQVEVFAQFAEDIPNPVNLSYSVVNDNFIDLSWENVYEDNGPDKNEITGAGINVYRNDQLVFEGSDIEQNEYQDGPLPVGSYTYYVAGRRPDGELIVPSNEVTVAIESLGNEYTLSVSVTGEGILSVPLGDHLFSPGSEIIIHATANENWTLTQWLINGTDAGNNDSIQITLQEDTSVEAIFEVDTWEIILNAEPEEAVVALEGAGIYDHGENITISAIPAVGYIFLHWLSNDQIVSTRSETTIQILQDQQFTAILEAREFTVNVEVEPEGTGSVAGAGTFGAGEQILLTATPEPGWKFKHWTREVDNDDIPISDDPLLEFILSEDLELKAVFEEFLPALNISVEGEGTTNPQPGEYNFEYNEDVTLVATPTTPWLFEKWVINDEEFTQPEIEIIMTLDIEATAYFYYPTATDEISQEDVLRVFPVPADNNINVVLPNNGSWNIQVIAVTGQIMTESYFETIAESPIMLDVSDLNSGIYFIKAQSTGKVYYTRIIVE